jgi:hypothetical protein
MDEFRRDVRGKETQGKDGEKEQIRTMSVD